MNNTKSNISAILRDPIWQALGAILGIVAFIVSTLVAYDIYFKSKGTPEITDMTVTQRYSYSLISDIGESFAERITLTLDGTEIKHLVIMVCSITNTGTNPIKPADFAEPLQVSVESPWEILSIDTGEAFPSDIELGWNRIAQNIFEMKPLLLNEKDRVEFLVYLTRSTDYKEIPELSWKGRVVDVKSFIDEPPVLSPPQKSPFPFLQILIHHDGWSPYLLVVLALFFFAISIYVGMYSGRLTPLTNLQILIFTIVAGISFASSDILTDVIMPSGLITSNNGDGTILIRFGDSNISSIHYIEWILLAVQLILLTYLAWPILKRKFNKQ